MPQFPFLGGSYPARSRNLDCQRAINLYPEVSQSGTSKTPGMLIGTPGLRRIATVGAGPIRGIYRTSGNVLLVASGQELYRLDQALATTLIGRISGYGQVSMADNGKSAMVVCGTAAYFVKFEDWSITQADAGVFTGGDRVAFLDGRLVWNMTGTGQFMWTGLYSTDLDALNYATAEGSPDALVSLLVDHRELWLFGATTTEVWFPTGDADLPMARIEGAFIEHGCAAPHSAAKLDNTVFWLGADDRGQGVIWRANGYTPQRISTHAVEYALDRLPRIDDAIAYTYQQEGHSFYVLTFPSASVTWVYDVATELWHERAWRQPGSGKLLRHRSNCQAAFAGLVVVGDFEDGRLYALDLDHYTDDEDLLPRIRVAPHLSDNSELITMAELRVDFETGVGLVNGQGSNPQAMLEVSKDYGHTWGNERWVPLGRLGERRARAIWRRLGQARDWVFRVTVTDPVPVRIIGASVLPG